MNKTTTLKWLVGLLVLLNIGIIAFMFSSRKPPHRHIDNKDKSEKLVQKRFNFDEDQMNRFRSSKEKHESKTTEISKALAESSRAYYQIKASDLEKKDSMRNEILLLSNEIYLANDQHFQEMREICRPDQLHELENFINSILGANKRSKRGKGPR